MNVKLHLVLGTLKPKVNRMASDLRERTQHPLAQLAIASCHGPPSSPAPLLVLDHSSHKAP